MELIGNQLAAFVLWRMHGRNRNGLKQRKDSMFDRRKMLIERKRMGRMLANPEMLALAREAEGHTVRELAEKLGINHLTLSRYEGGQLPIPDVLVSQIANILNRPERYFYRSGKTYGASGSYHRKRSGIPVRELNRIHAVVNELRLQAAALLEYSHVDTTNELFGWSTTATRNGRLKKLLACGSSLPVLSVTRCMRSNLLGASSFDADSETCPLMALANGHFTTLICLQFSL